MTEPSHLKLAIRPNAAVPFTIIYQDGEILVVDKPADIVTEPGKGHTKDTLLNGLFSRFGNLLHNMGERRDFGLLHRLDRQTSGLLVVAIRPRAYDELRADFENRRIEKEYLAMVAPKPSPAQAVIEARLKETAGSYKKVVVSPSGQDAVSAYRTLSANANGALVAVNIKTGRLHQIRAHMRFIGSPVLGDTLYGGTAPKPGPNSAIARICLHAARLGFRHPGTRQRQSFFSPLPADMQATLKRLGLSLDPAWANDAAGKKS